MNKQVNNINSQMEKIQAKLKHNPEDFIVEEIQDKWECKISENFEPNTKYQIPTTENSNAIFLWCEMEKREIDHFSAIQIIASHLNKSPQAIGYAGTKDKIAHTSQRISIECPSQNKSNICEGIESPDIEKLKTFSHPNIILKNFKWNKRKIKMGYLDANHFKITLRDIDKKDAMKVTNQIRKTQLFPNYFGPQRFGINNSNIEIGKAILKRNFPKALELVHKDNPRTESIQNIKHLPRKNLLIYVHAVQSKIFNEIVSQALEEGLNLEQKGQQNGILAGYKTRFSQGRLGEIEEEVLRRNNLELEDFNVEEIPFLKIKGSFRKAITKIENLEIETKDDDAPEFSDLGCTERCFKRKKIILKFTLPSGTYATTFLENFFIFD